jgi:hypothetical protein
MFSSYLNTLVTPWIDHFTLQNNKEEAEEKTRYWQLPWVPPPKEEPPSEEELARKAALKEKAGQRLREMSEDSGIREATFLFGRINGAA